MRYCSFFDNMHWLFNDRFANKKYVATSVETATRVLQFLGRHPVFAATWIRFLF